ncbi:hypothetical protein BD410DRAFT_724157 [Rickenella mellea]|uniref:DNA repair protein Crb2 Tudor domain-containing protein n=1 Tax=Rickenella mellea TaxID=50990 RepID=A0A4Y7Q1P8_9AGAM|nr:hypothetical protein BD410DRAFT_724157 [Rickenella mellea]
MTPHTGPPPSKRARTYSSFSMTGATRVFALWKSDGCYYTGTVHSAGNSASRFLVKFDDGTEDVVDVTNMRVYMLDVGDEVILPDKSKAKVVESDRWQSDGIVRVESDDGDNTTETDVNNTEIKIAGRAALGKSWKNRLLTVEDIVPAVGRKKITPSPSKISLDGGPSKPNRKILAKTGFVITLGPGNEQWAQEKDLLVRSITDTGGTVFSEWSDVFPMQGKHSNAGKRWVMSYEDVKFTQKEGIERMFLLADVFNQKPKFLFALALGIPCVSIEWLDQCMQLAKQDECRPWDAFLLPAGFSEALHARISQVVDLDWGSSLEHLTDIMSNAVPHKLLSGKNVLCLGTDLLPLAPKKVRFHTDNDKSAEASRMVPRIIFAMGAARVEAVAEARFASEKNLAKFDYVVVKEGPPKVPVGTGATVVDVSWIKDCLISARLLPLPEWSR